MWHLNIPIFNRLDQVAEHERRAVLALAGGWQSFGSNLPQAQRQARLNGLSPLTPASATGACRKPAREAPRDEEHPPGAHEAPRPSAALESVDVGFEVMRAAAFG
eukprot:CAMPEP_0179091022 /NCGR_PEP_ID=MMETSP0796-20121207/41559_1 /TAXON_ID=73915 /ORGANISM="Pyrodinium bahamense, Strain pbaha01" /LENGTH=104 /DNA_ID=CAMNT_0020788607 /DNA_START=65 /DNA_END=375 /DNA_ORIENTATION=-